MMQPLVSCVCTTYNRPPQKGHLVEEAIESFLRQDYARKEMIVLNDCPEQQLICDAPGVRVINAEERFDSLGEKLNAACRAADGDLLACWDDDDVSLPWRLSLSVDRLGDADYFNPRRHWFLDQNGWCVDHAMGVSHNLSLMRRSAFEGVGGYLPVSGWQDQPIDRALCEWSMQKDLPTGDESPLPIEEWFYVYRWGVSPVHISGSADHDEFYIKIGERPVVPGEFILRPRWKRDYVAETRRLIADRSLT